jgi:hypothetical protein
MAYSTSHFPCKNVDRGVESDAVGPAVQQPAEAILVENRHTEFDGLVVLRPG